MSYRVVQIRPISFLFRKGAPLPGQVVQLCPITGNEDPINGCQVGTNVLFCMPNRTKCVLLVSVMPDAGHPSTSAAVLQVVAAIPLQTIVAVCDRATNASSPALTCSSGPAWSLLPRGPQTDRFLVVECGDVGCAVFCRRRSSTGAPANPRGGDNPFCSADGHTILDIRFRECKGALQC
jgi:hypothetical protein